MSAWQELAREFIAVATLSADGKQRVRVAIELGLPEAIGAISGAMLVLSAQRVLTGASAMPTLRYLHEYDLGCRAFIAAYEAYRKEGYAASDDQEGT